MDQIVEFLEQLPHGLKMEVSAFIHESRYNKLKFLNSKSNSFISWFCPLLTSVYFDDKQYIYSQGEDVTFICFLLKGEAGFVLPVYENTTYIKISQGDHFGEIDIIGSASTNDFEENEWYKNKDLLQRQFTAMALNYTEVLNLTITDLSRMEKEFYDYYEIILKSGYLRLR